MKGLLMTVCSLFLFGATYAQDNKADRNDDESPTTISTPSNLDGSPNPGHHYHLVAPWNQIQTIAIAPFQYSENGVGVGLSYERALDPEGIISVYLPIIATWNLNTNNNNNYNGGYYPSYQNKPNSMYYAMPGVKFYPTGMGRVKYAVGPSAVIGVGQRMSDYNNYDPYYGYNYYSSVLENRFLLGMMLNNSLNINATPHLYIGAELGLGFTYFDRRNNINHGTTFLTQGSFKIGYTF